jgi:hypothetical protein
MHCHSNLNIDQRSGDLESCSRTPGSFVLPIAMTGHSKNIVVPLLVMPFLPLMLPSINGISSPLTVAVAMFGGLPGAEEGFQRIRPHYK